MAKDPNRQVMSSADVAAEVERLRYRGREIREEVSEVDPKVQYFLAALSLVGVGLAAFYLYITFNENEARYRVRKNPSPADICGTDANQFKRMFFPNSTCVERVPRPPAEN